jgi:hypothetical protein
MDKPKNEIVLFAHCATCAPKKPRLTSQAEWARIEAGLTPRGLQVWCRRCDLEVAHFSPGKIEEFMQSMPGCDCCPGGKHEAKP